MADDNCVCIFSLIRFIMSIGSFVIFILTIVYLFGIINNCKDEPTELINYLNNDPIAFYSSNDFCFKNYYLCDEQGIFKTFDIRIKKIKTFSRATVSTCFISICLIILSIIILFLATTDCKYHEGFLGILSIIYLLFSFINIILNAVFFIILIVHYFKSDFTNFNNFSECMYFKEEFKKDFQFINKIQDNFIKILILWIISFFLNLFDNVIKFCIKRNQ